MKSNLFFKKQEFKLKQTFSRNYLKNDFVVNEARPLIVAEKHDISFFDSIKYKDDAKKQRQALVLQLTNFKIFYQNQFKK